MNSAFSWRHAVRFGLALCAILAPVLDAGNRAWAQAAEKEPAKTLPIPDLKPAPAIQGKAKAPEDLAELRALEEKIQKVVAKVTPAVVGIQIGAAMGSGVIISEDGIVLTAGHVSGNPNQSANIILQDGSIVKAKSLGRNTSVDSGLIKITKEGKYPYADIGKSGDLALGEWVVAMGHPGGYRKNRGAVARAGRIIFKTPSLLQSDCTIVGGDSGGPLFDLNGRVVGIHSRIGGKLITENIHVPVDTFRAEWDRLAKGESFGGPIGSTATVQSAGGKVILFKEDRLSTRDKKDPNSESFYKAYPLEFKAGKIYTLDLMSPQFDSFLRIEDKNGKKLVEDDDSGGALSARIVFKPKQDATYNVIVTTFEAGQSGKYMFRVLEAEYLTGSVDFTRAIILPKPAIKMIFDNLGKSGIKPFMAAVTFDDRGEPVGNKEIVAVWEGGKKVLKSNAQGLALLDVSPVKARTLRLELPKGVKATVTLTDAKGNYVGPSFKDDPSIIKVKSAGGGIVREFTGSLTPEDPLDRDKTMSHHKVHELQLQAGKTYTLDLESDDFDSFLRLETAEAKTIAEDDDGAGFLNSRVVYTPSRDENIRVVATTFDGEQTGAYRLIVRQADTPVQSDQVYNPRKDKK